MNKTLFPLILLMLFFVACNSNTQSDNKSAAGTGPSQDAPKASKGQEIFLQRCQACHGVNGNYAGSGAANLQQSKLDSTGIAATIKSGRSAMPAFQGSLADADIAELTLYVRSIRK
jgi:mono/diheme cytochrome c family protein